MYRYDNGYNGYEGAAPNMRQRLDVMQAQQRYQGYQQPYPQLPASYPQYGQQQTPILNGRVVTGIEEARAAQIPLDGTMVYFPSPAEKKIYVKSIGLDGMPLFNVYEMATAPSGANNIVYADNAAVIALQRRVEQIENILKGAASNVQSNANDAANGTVAE